MHIIFVACAWYAHDLKGEIMSNLRRKHFLFDQETDNKLNLLLKYFSNREGVSTQTEVVVRSIDALYSQVFEEDTKKEIMSELSTEISATVAKALDPYLHDLPKMLSKIRDSAFFSQVTTDYILRGLESIDLFPTFSPSVVLLKKSRALEAVKEIISELKEKEMY